MMIRIKPLLIFFGLVMITSCSDGDETITQNTTNSMKELSSITEADLQTLSSKKIYFAHMSVGYNILEGVQMIADENSSINFRIVETRDKSAFSKPVLAHSRIGENSQPKYKMDDFIKVLDSGIGDSADVAFLKFCYVDIDRDTDIEEMFASYIKMTETIQQKYPDLTLLHLTVPLVVKPRDWKGKINKYLMRDRNIKRNQINSMYRNHFNESELFDVALYETILPEGERYHYRIWGKKVYVLRPELTYDGGHLNETGSRLIGEQLIIKLAEILSGK